MNKKEGIDDIESVRHNYNSLLQLHRVANNENDRMNDENQALRQEIKLMGERLAQMNNIVLLNQKMTLDAYNELNALRDSI